MASIIRVKRSTGTTAPATLYYGELAYTDGLALTANGGGRLFVGDQNEIPREVGGRYYTDMFLEPGKVAGQENKTTPANGFVAILDENRKVDEWNVDGYLNVTGVSTFIGTVNVQGEAFIGNVGISSDLIRTTSGDTLYIDPYPDGLSNQGTVVIKGNLQVDGDTTAINSSEVNVDDPILILADPNRVRTVVGSDVPAGLNVITIDSVEGINNGDIVTGSPSLSLSGVGTIVFADSFSNSIFLQDGIIAPGITTETQLTITTAFDDGLDRGIGFGYNTGIGTENNKIGFFGYDRSTNYWTFIPEADIQNGTVYGDAGTIDIGAAYFDFATSGIHTRGSAYFDDQGKLISTKSPEDGFETTSNYVLTTDGTDVPVWTSVLDGGSY